jgi:enoyl-CoA hydratase/3-hydroxyacyl-CoA dehydrogenase
MNALNETVVAQLTGAYGSRGRCPGQGHRVPGRRQSLRGRRRHPLLRGKIKAGRIPDISPSPASHELLLRIEESRKLTIALLDGLSLGGGSELALACQAIVATPAGSMAFPETGIGIYPGLGGMLRMARHVGPALAKYFAFTGAPISAADAQALGIVTRLVEPAAVDAAVQSLISGTKPDKYRPRDIPQKFKAFADLFGPGSVDMLFSGKTPPGANAELAGKLAKTLGYKAPLALRIANEIVDRQANLPMRDAVEIELGRLKDIFATADALEGLSSVGRRRPEFKGA